MAFETYAKSFALGTTSAALTTGLGANETLQITSATVVNTSGAARLVYLNLASDGAAAAAGNAVEAGKSVSANASAGTALTGMNVIPGAVLYGYADVAGATLQVHGLVTAQAERTW
jgi:hypothetical protein